MGLGVGARPRVINGMRGPLRVLDSRNTGAGSGCMSVAHVTG